MESVKKILFLITQPELGGAQKYVYEITRFLALENYDVTVATGKNKNGLIEKISKLKSQNSKLQLKVQSLNYLKRTPLPWQAILAIFEIYNLLKSQSPDILFLCSSSAGFFGSIAAFLYKAKFQVFHPPKFSKKTWAGKSFKFQVVYRIGGWAFNDPRSCISRKLIILAEKLTAPLKDKIIVNSEFDLQSALKHKIAPKEKIVKIYNGINPEELNFLSREKAQKELSQFSNLTTEQFNNSKIIGTIANLYKTKGLKYLIKAIHILQSRFMIYDLRFMIIGDGKERKKLERLIKKYNLQNVVFLLGRIPNAQKYLKAFDVFVLPSLKEGFPWAILEAMAGEIPIVATDVGAIPEIIENNKQGFLVKPNNKENLAKKIQELIKNPELRNRFTKSAKEKLKEFSKEKMLEKTKRVISKI